MLSGQPVGSRTISRASALGLSPATIRNVMQDLEEIGLLAAPHVSAGRKPTESGLRLFVDGMMQITQPNAEERRAIEARLGDPGPLEQRLEAASAMLSDLSGAAGMVLVPTAERRLAGWWSWSVARSPSSVRPESKISSTSKTSMLRNL